jgi:hypothetical protein
LLRRYYDGNSTIGEEQLLLEYFASEKIPDEFAAERDLFKHLPLLSEDAIPDPGFEERIKNSIFPTEIKAVNKHKYRRLSYSILSTAASVLLLISFWVYYNQTDRRRDTFSSPELAYAETIMALQKVSSGLNKGTSALKPLESINIVERSFRDIDGNMRSFERGVAGIEAVQTLIDGKENEKTK